LCDLGLPQLCYFYIFFVYCMLYLTHFVNNYVKYPRGEYYDNVQFDKVWNTIVVQSIINLKRRKNFGTFYTFLALVLVCMSIHECLLEIYTCRMCIILSSSRTFRLQWRDLLPSKWHGSVPWQVTYPVVSLVCGNGAHQ
jgi:hypothetical protein